jgi:hypothetical protein
MPGKKKAAEARTAGTKRFTVRLSKTFLERHWQEATVSVKANSAEEAKKKAEEMVNPHRASYRPA